MTAKTSRPLSQVICPGCFWSVECEASTFSCRLGKWCRCGRVQWCELPETYVRFDIAVRDKVYLGVAMHGAGGVLRERHPDRALARAQAILDEPDCRFPVRFYTTMDRDGGTSFYVQPPQVKLLAVHINPDLVRQ